VLLQHPDGKTALIRGDVDAWAGLDPMMAQAEVEDGAKLFFRKPDATPGASECARGIPEGSSRPGEARACGLRGRAQVLARELSGSEARVHRGDQAPEAVVDKQLKERTELTHSRIGHRRRNRSSLLVLRCNRRA